MGLAGAVAVAACSKQEQVLTGEREDIRSVLSEDQAAADDPSRDAEKPVSLPGATANAEWRQRPGTEATRTDHPALAAGFGPAWSVSIGAGDERRARVTADPVVAGGRIFTLDSQAQVAAVSTSGKMQWTRSLVPATDNPGDATGGGLAFGEGKLFVSTGFGELTALDPATGKEIWQQDLQATGNGNPTVYDGLVYLVAGDEIAWALDADTGRIKWQLSATPDINNVMGGPAPALSSKYAVFAFGSGEVQGAFRKGGLRLWDTQIAGQRLGRARSRIADITGDPVIDGGRIYVGSHSGRTVALKLADGERLWTATDGPLSPVWPAGRSLYMITDRNELVRLNASDGRRVWGTRLPFFVKDKPRRQNEVFAHYGPVMAGGQLIVASNDGLIRVFDPVSGKLARTVEIPGGATTNPVVAGRTLYLVSAKGQLHAFR